MSVSNRNSRIHARVTQAHKKCAMKIKETNKEKRNNRHIKKLLITGRTLYDYQKLDVTDVDELQVNNSHTLKVRTICLVNG